MGPKLKRLCNTLSNAAVFGGFRSTGGYFVTITVEGVQILTYM